MSIVSGRGIKRNRGYFRLLKVSNLVKNFGSVKALKDASLRLEQGEIRALLGSNGSGKSTLVKVLSGLNRKDGGTIVLDGGTVDITSPAKSIRMGIAMAYQDLSLIPKLSVMDNIILGNEPRRMLGKDKKRRSPLDYTTMMIDKLGIGARPETIVSDMDLSNQGLVEVAKALYSNPKILILDEVTASMHHDQVQRLFSFLKELAGNSLSLLFVSHRFDEVYNLCETATILREGTDVKDVILADTGLGDLIEYMTGQQSSRVMTNGISAGTGEAYPVFQVRSLNVGGMVKDASIHVSKGEIIGIAGLQGQGQTEFLRALYAAIPYNHGSIELDGCPLKLRSPAGAIRAGIGFISGDRDKEGILAIRSVAENILVVQNAARSLLSAAGYAKQKKHAEAIMETLRVVAAGVGIPANSLSGGNQQKLLIGRWLSFQPRLLLLDDPTKGVDVKAREEINALLREMTKTGMSVIFSSSDNGELLRVAGRIYVFYENRIIAELCGSDLTEKKLASIMLGSSQEYAS
jgi:ABC-type sugar transport system ATPase subunit